MQHLIDKDQEHNYNIDDRVYYISTHELLNLLKELRKSHKMRGLPSILSFFATSFINMVKQKHECWILYII